MSVSFRCACIDKPEEPAIPIDEFFEKVIKEDHCGFFALYANTSLILGAEDHSSNSAKQLKTVLEHKGFTLEQPLTPSNRWKFQPKKYYLLAAPKKQVNVFPQQVHILEGKLRAGLANAKVTDTPVLSLSQCTVHEILNDRYGFSDFSSLREYIVWDDGRLWDIESKTEDWHRLRSVWLGAGWMARKLTERLSSNNQEPWRYVPEISLWAGEAQQYLLDYDQALINFYKEKQKTDVLGRESWNGYIRTLCDFLPHYYSKDKSESFPSSSAADKGGPKRWKGLLEPRMHMHLRHLILDGWVTLWPVREGDKVNLYYQPGSMALLYWAARQASMPWTRSPEEFLQGYDWSDPRWFGGQWCEPKPQPR